MQVIQSVTGRLYELSHKHRRPGYNFIKFKGQLYAKHFRNGMLFDDRGLVGANVVTTEFCEDVVDNLIAEVAAFGDYKFHQSGVGSGGPVIGDTAATLDLTGPPPTPATGTQIESTAVIYESVATVNYTSSLAITEHGLGNNATWLSGTLMDRHTFTVINVVNTDSIEFTYDLTVTAGG